MVEWLAKLYYELDYQSPSPERAAEISKIIEDAQDKSVITMGHREYYEFPLEKDLVSVLDSKLPYFPVELFGIILDYCQPAIDRYKDYSTMQLMDFRSSHSWAYTMNFHFMCVHPRIFHSNENGKTNVREMVTAAEELSIINRILRQRSVKNRGHLTPN